MLDVSNYNNNSRELNAFWDNFLSKVKERVNYMQYTTWFSKTRLVTIDNSKAIVIVSKDIHKFMLSSDNYKEIMDQVSLELTNKTFIYKLLTNKEWDTLNNMLMEIVQEYIN